jgi:hypothetical protein
VGTESSGYVGHQELATAIPGRPQARLERDHLTRSLPSSHLTPSRTGTRPHDTGDARDTRDSRDTRDAR